MASNVSLDSRLPAEHNHSVWQNPSKTAVMIQRLREEGKHLQLPASTKPIQVDRGIERHSQDTSGRSSPSIPSRIQQMADEYMAKYLGKNWDREVY